MKQRRKYTRFSFCHAIVLIRGRKRVRGQLRDLSLRGAYVVLKSTRGFVVGEEISYDLTLAEVRPAVHICGKAVIVRQDCSGGLGLRFLSMTGNDFSLLRKLVECNLGDAGLVKKEIGRLVRSDDF